MEPIVAIGRQILLEPLIGQDALEGLIAIQEIPRLFGGDAIIEYNRQLIVFRIGDAGTALSVQPIASIGYLSFSEHFV